MSNPYQSPSPDLQQFQDHEPQPTVAGGFGWVNQVRIVAILSCVQGVLEIPLGLFMTAAAFFVPQIMQLQKAGGAPGDGQPPWLDSFLQIVYMCIGIPLVLCGAFRIFTGIQNFNFRGRTLGFISFFVGLVSAFSCYCLPTSIALLVYGMIVYLNPAVATAFEMGRHGITANSILATFATGKPAA